MKARAFSIFLLIATIVLIASCHKHNPLAYGTSTLKISSEGDPQTLDPRKARDLSTTTIMHMLYEGLMRNESDGHPIPAIAESIKVSQDQKTYTFVLRPCQWSNGDPVTAHDFEQTWKSLLDPEFPCCNAYQLYAIKGAQAAKEGKIPLDQVGVHATDDQTLVVELEQSTPYFLHLVTTHFYYPTHSSLRQTPNEENNLKDFNYVTNGPYQIESWHRHSEFSVIPNSNYWDRKNVHLGRILFIILDNPTALQLFQRGELDWTGSPLSTICPDALASLKKEGKLEIKPGAGIYLFRINTEKLPFTYPKMRQAFAMALNRDALVENVLQGNQTPAFGIIPPSFLGSEPGFHDHDLESARKLFKEASNELSLDIKNFPKVCIYYAANERAHKIAQVAQQQWMECFGIDVSLQSQETKVFFERLKNHDYQLGVGSWFADFRDPISFLEVFKLKNNGTNNTQWENQQYILLLEESSKASQTEREALLKKAEKLIIEEMPVVPLFFASYNYVKKSSVKGVYFSELGYLDFKNAYIE